jgi:hypothetical protein
MADTIHGDILELERLIETKKAQLEMFKNDIKAFVKRELKGNFENVVVNTTSSSLRVLITTDWNHKILFDYDLLESLNNYLGTDKGRINITAGRGDSTNPHDIDVIMEIVYPIVKGE